MRCLVFLVTFYFVLAGLPCCVCFELGLALVTQAVGVTYTATFSFVLLQICYRFVFWNYDIVGVYLVETCVFTVVLYWFATRWFAR